MQDKMSFVIGQAPFPTTVSGEGTPPTFCGYQFATVSTIEDSRVVAAAKKRNKKHPWTKIESTLENVSVCIPWNLGCEANVLLSIMSSWNACAHFLGETLVKLFPTKQTLYISTGVHSEHVLVGASEGL